MPIREWYIEVRYKSDDKVLIKRGPFSERGCEQVVREVEGDLEKMNATEKFYTKAYTFRREDDEK